MHINKTDKKILFELIKNSRQSLNQISKTTKIPKSSIQYKIKSLEKNGIIISYYTFIDNSFLRPIYAKLGLNLFNTNKEKLKTIIKKLKIEKNISKIYATHGAYDLCIGISTNSIQELYIEIQKIQELIGDNIRKQNITLVYEITMCFPDIIFENNFIEPLKILYNNNKLENLFDYKLLKKIRNNSQISIVELARKLNTSTTKIISHKKRLEEKNIILAYSTIPNFEKLGYFSYNVFWHFNKIIPERVKEFKKYLIKLKETLFTYDTMGSTNIESHFLCKNENDLYNLLLEIKEKFPNLISHYDVMIITETHKCEF